MKVVFHRGQGNQEGVPWETDLSSCVNGNQEGVPCEGGLSSRVKANHEECPSGGCSLSFQGNNWGPTGAKHTGNFALLSEQGTCSRKEYCKICKPIYYIYMYIL